MDVDFDSDRDAFQEAARSTAGRTLNDGGGPPAATAATSSTADMSAQPRGTQLADALERKLRQQREEAAAAKAAAVYVAFDEGHEKRQEFRRLVDPGILRPNARPLALEALQTLLKLCENILTHPDEEKYRKFRLENTTIKRVLKEPKGTLEYARALGFNPEVKKFDQFYTFNKKHMSDLQIGAEILREALERELTKEERTAQAKREEKAAAAAEKDKIKQQFYDDRKSQALRSAKEARSPSTPMRQTSTAPVLPSPPAAMPGTGHTLTGELVSTVDDDDDDD